MSQPIDPAHSPDRTTGDALPLAAEDGTSLLGILEEIREVVRHARPVPMSASVRVNRAELLELVDAAANVVPSSIHTAERVVAESSDTIARADAEAQRVLAEATRRHDAVLADAEEQAARIIEKARAQGEELIADERVVHLAEHRSRELVAEARAEAARLADNANVYADERLGAFAEELEALRKQVDAGRDAITKRRADVAEDLESAYAAAEEARKQTSGDPADRRPPTREDVAGASAAAQSGQDPQRDDDGASPDQRGDHDEDTEEHR